MATLPRLVMFPRAKKSHPVRGGGVRWGGLVGGDEGGAGLRREAGAVLQPVVRSQAGLSAWVEAASQRGLLSVHGGAELRAGRVDVVHGVDSRKAAR